MPDSKDICRVLRLSSLLRVNPSLGRPFFDCRGRSGVSPTHTPECSEESVLIRSRMAEWLEIISLGGFLYE